ncbi:MAG: hypothetical protein JSR80_00785 [Verrucomicrobia bacterium]|nr:hypothetical protein [Verrucomicrobiota bacterium]
MINVDTLGSPIPLRNNLARDVTNHYVPNDPVTLGWSHMRHAHSKYNIVRWPAGRSVFSSHALQHQSYQLALAHIAKKRLPDWDMEEAV